MAGKIFYQTGGALTASFPSYVERKADNEMLNLLLQGEFCYILTARQMGKSSLKVRTIQKLRERDWHCVNLEVTRFGTDNSNASNWYFSFLEEICRPFRLEDEFEEWEAKHVKLTPVAKFSLFWEDFLLPKTEGQIGVFIDEIDSMLSLNRDNFRTDDFFAAIRTLYNSRFNNPDLLRLQFCILGVASPKDLMADPTRTPFNIGKAIHLGGLDLQSSEPLARGLEKFGGSKTTILKEIIDLTGGQPYLTQCLCLEVSKSNVVEGSQEIVQRAVQKLFLSPGKIEEDGNLSYVNLRARAEHIYKAKMLGTYFQLLKEGSIPINSNKPEYTYLKLTGLVKEQDGSLMIFNPIYHRVFNEKWIEGLQLELDRPFTNDMIRWKNNDYGIGFLLRGEALQQALDWAAERDDLSNEERSFFDESTKLEREKNRQTRRRLVAGLFVLAIFFIAAVTGAISGFYLNGLANRAKKIEEALSDSLEIVLSQRDRINHSLDSINEELVNSYILAQEQRDKAENLRLINKGLYLEEASRGRKIDSIREALRLNNIARSLFDNYPTLALKVAERALSYDKNKIVTQTYIDIKGSSPLCTKILRLDQSSPISAWTVSLEHGFFICGNADNYDLGIWDLNTGELLGTLKGHNDYVYSIDISKDGKKCVSSSRDKNMRVWDLESQSQVQSINGHEKAIYSVSFSPNGRKILSGSYDKTLKLWDVESKELLHTFIGHNDAVYRVVFSPDGQHILSGSADKTLRLWELSTGKLIHTYEGHIGPIRAIDFSPDGNRIVSGSSDNSLIIWDTYTEKIEKVLDRHSDNVLSACFSSDGKNVVSVSMDNTVKFWDAESGEMIRSLNGHSNSINYVSYGLDDHRFVTGSEDNSIRIWEAKNGHEIQSIKVNQYNARNFIEANLGSGIAKLVFTSSDQFSISKIFEKETESISALKMNSASNDYQELTILLDSICAQSIPSKTDLIVGKRAQDRDENTSSEIDIGITNSKMISPDRKKVLTTSNDGIIRLWNRETSKIEKEFVGHKSAVFAAIFSPNGKTILSASKDKTIRLWDIKTGKVLRKYSGHKDYVFSISFFSGGDRFVSGSYDNKIILWETSTGQVIKEFEGHTDYVNYVDISPSESLIASASADETIRIWDVKTGKQIKVFEGNGKEITFVSFFKDEKKLFSISSDNLVKFWNNIIDVDKIPAMRSLLEEAPVNFKADLKLLLEE